MNRAIVPFQLFGIILIIGCVLALNILPTSAQNTNVDLCVRAFQDTNRNGQFDDGEQNLSSIEVFVTNAANNQLFGSMTTTPDLDCLRSIPAGSYQVEFRDSIYQPTTPTTFNTTITDQTVTVDYGAVLPQNNTPSTPVAQNSPGNQICILVFRDENTNGQRESSEGLIRGIDVNLTVDSVITDTLVTSTDQEYTCFDDLSTSTYSVIIPDTLRHVLSNENIFEHTFTDTGQRVTVEFGAVLLDPFSADAELQNFGRSDDEFTLDDQSRLLLAIFGAGMVILFMIGFGAILLSIIRR